MPTIGSFHGKYWRGRVNVAPPAGGAVSPGMYPGWQRASIGAVTAGSFALFEAVAPIWAQFRWYWRLAGLLWWQRSEAQHREIEARLMAPADATSERWKQAFLWLRRRQRTSDPIVVSEDVRVATWYREATDEQRAVVDRVLSALAHPQWEDARALVRACATSPKFHQPEQWVEYGRALKANAGQAQNVFRHVKVVHELRAAHPDLSNPEAHLLTELAYHAHAAQGRADRKVVTH